MRCISFPRSLLLAVALIFAGMILTDLHAGAQVPAGPAGGLDPNKLPDVYGIHLGMNEAQALALVKSKYPANLITLFYTKFKDAPDAPWVARIVAKKMGVGNNQANSVDDITIWFNTPPKPQVVIRVDRSVMIIPMTTIGNLETSLLQKYGPSLIQKTISANLSWEFDEEGKATPVPAPYICTSFNTPVSAMPAALGAPATLEFGQVGYQPIATQIPRLTRMCPDKIVITTLLPPKPGNPDQLMSNLTVSMIDHAEDLRDFIAMSQYGEAAAVAAQAKQKQKVLQNAPGAPPL